MYTLNNVTTGNEYTAANELLCPGSNSQLLVVTGASVFYQQALRSGVGFVSGAPPFEAETFLPPGYYNWVRPLERFRVRSAVTGKPAQVTITAQ